MKQFIFLVLLTTLILAANISAQEQRAGKFGIGYSGNFTSETNVITATLWAIDDLAIEPQFGFNTISVDEGPDASAYRVGLGALYYLSNTKVLPYVGLRVSAAIASMASHTYTDMTYSAVFGGDYFVSDWFSVGAELRLNYGKTDKDFSPLYLVESADIFFTEQVLNIKLYFN